MKTIIFEDEVAYKTKYEGYYVCKSGKVVTVKIKGGRGLLDYDNPREHCYKIDKDGYAEVCISFVENGIHKRKYIRVHRLVYETICGDIPDDLTIDHIDSNRRNNSIENLALISRAENTRKALKGKKSSKRAMYSLYKDEIFLGVFDRLELESMIGVKHKDYYQDTKNKQQLLLQGYKWNIESVEDIQRIS